MASSFPTSFSLSLDQLAAGVFGISANGASLATAAQGPSTTTEALNFVVEAGATAAGVFAPFNKGAAVASILLNVAGGTLTYNILEDHFQKLAQDAQKNAPTSLDALAVKSDAIGLLGNVIGTMGAIILLPGLPKTDGLALDLAGDTLNAYSLYLSAQIALGLNPTLPATIQNGVANAIAKTQSTLASVGSAATLLFGSAWNDVQSALSSVLTDIGDIVSSSGSVQDLISAVNAASNAFSTAETAITNLAGSLIGTSQTVTVAGGSTSSTVTPSDGSFTVTGNTYYDAQSGLTSNTDTFSSSSTVAAAETGNGSFSVGPSGDGTFSLSTTSDGSGASQFLQTDSSGSATYQQFLFNGATVDASASDLGVLGTASTGALELNITSPISGEGVTLDAASNGSDQILVSSGTASAPQQVLDYATDGLGGDTIDIANVNGMFDITTEIGPDAIAAIGSQATDSGVIQNFQFGTPVGVLEIEDPVSFTGTIDNFLPGDTIVLSGISVDAATITAGGDLLATADDGSVLSLQLDPSMDYSDYELLTYGDEISAVPTVASSGEQSVTVNAPVYDIENNQTITYSASVSVSPTDLNFAAERTDNLWLQDVPIQVTFTGGDLDPNADQDDVFFGTATTNTSDFFVSQGLATGLGPDNTSGTIAISTNTYLPGDYSGETVPLAVSYDGSTAELDLTIGDRKIYQPAEAEFSIDGTPNPFYDLGIIHVGQSVSLDVAVTNVATGALVDVLSSGTGSAGQFAASSAVADLASGASGNITVAITGDTPGIADAGPGLFDLLSEDPDLPAEAASAEPMEISVQVNDYASPSLYAADLGSATMAQNGNNWTLNFGIINLAGTLPADSPASIDIVNQAPAGFSDLLDGTLTVSGAGFGSGISESSVSDIEGGEAFPLGAFYPDLSQTGMYTETVVFQPESYDTSSTTPLADDTLTVEDVVVDATPSITDRRDGLTASGTLTNPGQRDWIAVNLEANQAYEISVNGLTSQGQVSIETAGGSDGSTASSSALIGEFFAANNYAYFMPGTTGTYYIDVADPYAITPENYSVNVAAVTVDHGDNPATAGTIAVGGTVAGTLANIAQHDWIAVNLTANQAYEVTVNGLTSQGEVSVVTASGLDGSDEASSGLIGDFSAASNYAYFMPGTTGTYYIDIADPYAITPENYSVNVAAVTVDYADNATTTGSVAVGGGIQDVTIGGTITPFVNINISDLSGQNETLTILASDAGNGSLSNLGNGSYNSTTGVYTDSGSAAAITADLDGLAFTPSAGAPALTTFQISVVDAGGATALSSAPSVQSVECFVEGTLITTSRGPVAVEHLEVGDLVTAVFGGNVPLIWIGSRKINCGRHPRPCAVRPVCIARNTLGTGVPYRDVWLSPDHAVLINDVLIPVKHLINGESIYQVSVGRVVYYHLELAHHDVVLANGLPSESYLDVGDRRKFSTSHNVVDLFPDLSARTVAPALFWEAYGCAPLVVTGPEVLSARQLVDRIAASGRHGTFASASRLPSRA